MCLTDSTEQQRVSAPALTTFSYQGLLKTRAHGLLSLLHPIFPVDPSKKAILKTPKVGLLFFPPNSTCSHQDQQRLRAWKVSQTRPDQKPQVMNDTPVLPKAVSVGTCLVERDVLSEGNVKGRAQHSLVYASHFH